jgi:autotransporter translocation and assembly factor TamB
MTADAVVDRDRGARIVARWVPGDSGLIHLDTVDLRTPVGSWGLAHPVEIQYGDRLSVGDLVLASGTQRIAVDGDIDRRGEQSLHATVKSVRFGPLVEVLGVRNLDGLVDGDFDLQGPAASPRAVGDLSVRFLSAAKRLGRVRGALDWDSLGLNLDLALIPSKGDSLTVKGLVPIGLSLVEGDSAHGVVRPPSTGRLELDARTSAFRLESLEPLLRSDDIGEVKGLLSMDIAIRGTTEEPETSGSIRLRDLKVNALKLGATYKGTAEAALAGRELRLTAARFRTGDGEAEATGVLRLVDSSRVGVALEANFREFQIAEARNFGSKLSGRIHLGGTSVAPELSGEVTTDNTYFYLTSDNSSSAIADVELTPEELETVERRFGSLARSKEKELGLFDTSSLDLSVTLGPNNWIRRRSDPVVAVELGGAVDIRKQPRGKLDVRGDVQALTGRSFLETVGRRFELTRGGAKLNGPLETAELDLEAEYRVATQRQASESDVTITAEVTADTGSIAITLGSRPNMEQRDIMSYLLTGAPATTDPTLQSNSNQNYLSTGASLAVGAALGTIAGSAGQELGFDVVQILQDMQGAQTLVAGKYVSPDLYLGFRQPLSESTTDDEDPENVANVMEFEVEYAAFRKALLNLQGAGSEFRVFLRLRGGN